jgi:lipid II:glycine glycyltransferase (peptidoglycan interpeptide bridge formation enzyme)
MDDIRRRNLEGIPMSIEIIKDKEQWDGFIEESPHGLIFHKWDFLKIMEKYSTYELNAFGIYDGDALIGLIPIFNKKIKGIKTSFSPPPKMGVPYLGLVLGKQYDGLSQRKKEICINSCADEINGEILKYNPNYLLINAVPNFVDIRPFQWNGYSAVPSFTYIIDLQSSLDEIWNNFHRYLKKDIRHAENKSELNLQPSGDISFFYEMQKKRYSEQNLSDPLHSYEYIDTLFKAFPEYLKIYYVYKKEELVGAITAHEYKDRFMTWMGTAKSTDHANEFLIWKLIQQAKENDYKEFELMGAGKRNLCQFKAKFNPSLEVSYVIQKKDTIGKISEILYANLIKKKFARQH